MNKNGDKTAKIVGFQNLFTLKSLLFHVVVSVTPRCQTILQIDSTEMLHFIFLVMFNIINYIFGHNIITFLNVYMVHIGYYEV